MSNKQEYNRFWEQAYKIRYQSRLTEKQTATECAFLEKYIPISQYKRVVDFACGHGRHSLCMAKNAHIVDGFDTDTQSIHTATAFAQKLNLEQFAHFTVKDLMDFNKKDIYDAGICMYSSIGYLSDNDNAVMFSNFLSSVKSEGRIILDLMNPDWVFKHSEKKMRRDIEVSGIEYHITHTRRILNNPVREYNAIEFDKKIGGQDRFEYTLRIYSFEEIKSILEKHGYKIIYSFGSFDEKPVSDSNPRIITIADRIIKVSGGFKVFHLKNRSLLFLFFNHCRNSICSFDIRPSLSLTKFQFCHLSSTSLLKKD